MDQQLPRGNRNSNAAGIAACLMILCSPTQLFASETVKQGAVHEHGKVTVNIAVDGELLTAELETPALHVLGFERAPRTDQEKTALEQARAWLSSGNSAFGVPRAAACKRENVAYTGPDWQGGEQEHDHDHDHDHEHDHDADTQHADYLVRYTYRCANPAALTAIELWLLRRLRAVEEVQVNLVSATQQRQLTLTGDELRVALR